MHNRKDTGRCRLLNHDLVKVTEKKFKKKINNQTALPSQTSAFCAKAAIKHVSRKPQYCKQETEEEKLSLSLRKTPAHLL